MKLAIFGTLALAAAFFMRGQAVPIFLAVGISCLLVGLLG